MYWSEVTLYEPVASTLTLKRYKKLREFLHVVDNAEKDKPENEDRYFKVKSLLEAVRANCRKVEQEINNSIDKQIIPAKTKKSGSFRQYNPKKRHKWGSKNLVRAGEPGIIYPVLYMISSSVGVSIILKLSERIQKNKGYRLFFDTWFSTCNLMLQLKSSGIFTTATFLTKHLKGCPLQIKNSRRKGVDHGLSNRCRFRASCCEMVW